MPMIRDGRITLAPSRDFIDFEAYLETGEGENIILSPDSNIEGLKKHLQNIESIQVSFPAFTDGRGFSLARSLRKRLGYKGEIIATGHLIPDQYAFAVQCGFDAVQVDDAVFQRQSEDEWASALEDFGAIYQRGYTHTKGPKRNIIEDRERQNLVKLAKDYEALDARQALQQALTKDFKGEIVLASSFGVDSAVLLHLVAQIDPNVPIVFLDTQKHFDETLEYRDMLIEQLGLTNVTSVQPKPTDINSSDADGVLWVTEPDACCEIRKVKPLADAIRAFKGRITGRKRYQTPDRAEMPILEVSGRQIKLNPLATWTSKDVTQYMRDHDLPTHPLLAMGFLSVGCAPCTTPVAADEDPRAGRWRDTEKTECGIHYIDGKPVPTREKVRKSETSMF